MDETQRGGQDKWSGQDRKGSQDKNGSQDIFIRNRNFLRISGVHELLGFDETNITLDGAFGTLSIDGRELKIKKMSDESGELEVEGDIGGVIYFDNEPQKKKRSLFGRG